MALNGSGVYLINSIGQPVVANTLISAAVFNAFTADIAAALSTAIMKDGQQTVTANIPLGGYKLTGLGDATTAGDAVRLNGALGTPSSLVLTNATGTPASIGLANGTGLPAAGVTGTAVTGATLQGQTYTAFTTGGTSTAFTLTPTPAITANAANQRFRVKFNAASGATPTLAVSGQTALLLKYRDSAGAKQAITSTQVPINWTSDVVNDGTDLVVLEVPPAAAVAVNSSVPVRQTVLSGPVDSNGFSAFGGSTGSTTVTASGTLQATAAAGGDTNYTGSIVNPSWTGLSTNGTMFLYLDITSGGVVTTGSTTLEPTYQWGGTYSTTNLQNTFNIQEITMKVGNGSTASQVYRVFVGQVTVAGGVVTAITWYALMGRYDSGWTSTLPNSATSVSKNSNVGVYAKNRAFVIENTTTDAGYAVGDQLQFSGGGGYNGVNISGPAVWVTANTVGGSFGGASCVAAIPKGGGASISLTVANWKYKFTAERGW